MRIINRAINSNIPLSMQSSAPRQSFDGLEGGAGHKSKHNNAPVLLSTIVGTVIPVLAIRKSQGKSLKTGALKGLNLWGKTKAIFKSYSLNYGLKEMLLVSFGSIAGGLAGGLIFNKKERKKPKIKEAIFQFSNIAIPTTIVAQLLKYSETNKHLKNRVLPKIASVLIGVGAGMPIAAVVSNKINNVLVDKEHPNTRRLKLSDTFVHVDDLFGALVLMKIPLADKLQADKILPILYGKCGYEAGTK